MHSVTTPCNWMLDSMHLLLSSTTNVSVLNLAISLGRSTSHSLHRERTENGRSSQTSGTGINTGCYSTTCSKASPSKCLWKSTDNVILYFRTPLQYINTCGQMWLINISLWNYWSSKLLGIICKSWKCVLATYLWLNFVNQCSVLIVFK